jgi:hypothetical protein
MRSQKLNCTPYPVPGAICVQHTDFAWLDLFFLTEQVRRQKYGVDSSALRAYLPVPAVKQGLLEISSKFFQMEFRKRRELIDVAPQRRDLGRFRSGFHDRENLP